MTDDKKHDDKDRKKLSDEEMEDVDGGLVTLAAFAFKKGDGKKKPGGPDGDGKLSKKERKR
jgi:hypothetical protein